MKKSSKIWLGTATTIITGVLATVIANYFITGKLTDRESKENTEKVKIPEKQTVIPPPNAQLKDFEGNVGKLKARFSLAFNDAKHQIHGTYYYPRHPDVIYEISGKITGNKIELTEFTNNAITATCKLTQNANGCFSGIMYNTDGHNFPMNFCQTD